MINIDKLDDYLKLQAIMACIEIYNDYAESETKELSPSIQSAWGTGEILSRKWDEMEGE